MATSEMALTKSGDNTPVHVPTDSEIETIRKKGAVAVAHQREVNRFANMLAGTEWGRGASEMTRYVVAEFCKVVGAHPVYHIDILGGRPYLNANFWSDRLNSDERFVDFEQINISDDAERRKHYGVPEWATFAYETVVRRLVPFAPIEKIRSGEITDWKQYVVETREAGWAGGKGSTHGQKDPVGDEHPSKTARTRSLRRTGARAMAAWMQRSDEQVAKAERALEAEWEEIKPDRDIQMGRALTAGSGEPFGATVQAEATAQPLPTREVVRNEQPTRYTEPEPEPARPQTPSFNVREAQQKYFGLLKLAGIGDRKAFAAANDLPDSVTKFTADDFARATTLLEQRIQRHMTESVGTLGFETVEEYAESRAMAMPSTYEELKSFLDVLNGELGG